MSSEIAAIDDMSLDLLPAAQPVSLAARQMLHAHAEMMQTAWELASKMCNTNLVPTRFRGKADDGTAAILYGAELGLNPIQSLQRVIPIHGMPSLEARTMVALLKSRGYRIKTLEQSDDQVTVEGVDLAGERYVSQWTIQRAIKAGYVPQIDEKTGKYRLNANNKLIGNEKYLTDPQAMLKAKAQAEVCRDMAPEVLMGISYTAEELESERFDDERTSTPTPPAQQPRSAPITVEEILNTDTNPEPARNTPTEPAPEPTEPAEPETRGEPPGGLSESTPGQTDRVKAAIDSARLANAKTSEVAATVEALLSTVSIADPADINDIASHILEAPIDGDTQLTMVQLKKVRDTIAAWNDLGTLANMVNDILNAADYRRAQEATEGDEDK